MFSDAILKNQFQEKLNSSAKNARSKENNGNKRNWIPLKTLFSRHKRTPSSTSAVQLK